DYRGLRLLTNSGSWAGFTPLIWMVPAHHFAVMVIANKGGGAFFTKTARKAIELMLPLQPGAAVLPYQSQTMSEAEMADCVGTYANENVSEVLLKDGQLFLRDRDMIMPMTRIGRLRFAVTIPGTSQMQSFLFLTGPHGRLE